MLDKFFKLSERKSAAGYQALFGVGIATAANIAVTPEQASFAVRHPYLRRSY
jgi:hypothetical protein